jgi:hypothetical protein
VSVLLGKGGGSFQPQIAYGTGEHPSSVAVADVLGDGLPGIVTADAGDNTVSVLRNNGHGSLQAPLSFATDQQPLETLVADVNGDGLPDLLN